MSYQMYQEILRFNGSQYAVPSKYTAYQNQRLMAACGPVYTVLDRRVSVMGEARPTFQGFTKGRPDEMFSGRELDILKVPWPGGTWRHLVAACEADVAAHGNSYWVRTGDQLVRLNPEWVVVSTGSVSMGGVEVGERLLGYVVQPYGRPSETLILEPGQVAHYRPSAPVDSPFRGDSWLAAVACDASADIEMTSYKGNYLKNGAMPSIAVTYEPTLSQEALEAFVPVFADKFTGSMNAGKVMHFLGGRDVKTVGASLDDLAFRAVQGAGETRIAAAAGVPAVVAAFSEGMQGSSLNAGNYSATRRLFADAKIRPLLGSLCDAFSALVNLPTGARLWYDDAQVSFFQEDVKDEADIRQAQAVTIQTLINSGYEPDAAVLAVTSGRFEQLVGGHTGLVSVQLQEPGASPAPVPTPQGGPDVPKV
jgi:hypothetical protein